MSKKETSTVTVNGENKNTIVFSLCHTTARLPDGWREAIQMWKDRADHPELVEHVFVTDGPHHVENFKPIFESTWRGVNNGRKCCVDGWNLAAKLSSGQFLINVADDLFPPEHWDTLLFKELRLQQEIRNRDLKSGDWWDFEMAFDVETGAPNWTAAGSGLMTFCFVTRKYYERYGYLLYPEYISVYSDNDFTDQARRDGVVVDARHLKFEHRHPIYDQKVKTDSVYENQSSSEAWEVGRKVYIKRSQSRGFAVRKKLMVCLPGERYSATWVAMWTTLLMTASRFMDVCPIQCYSTNVHVTRASLAHAVTQSKPSPDYVLWIDDDNLLTFDQLAMMIKDLEDHPDAGSVSAWTWIQGDVYQTEPRVSVGYFDESGDCPALRYAAMQKSETDLIEIDWTGFPAVLMTYDTIVRAGGHKAFQPYPAPPKHPYGFYGEDTSFCINAKNNGVKMLVDRRIKVPHLKLQNIGDPIMPTVARSAMEEFADQDKEVAANV